METYQEETNWFHVYANAPGIHGRLMATVASDELAKRYLYELDGLPMDSWSARILSEDESQVNVWVSHYRNPLENEAAGTYFTLERVRVVKAILKPDGLVCGQSDA